MMNHDATHCADYERGKCPKNCYRAQLTQDLKDSHYTLPVSFSHIGWTDDCPLIGKKAHG